MINANEEEQVNTLRIREESSLPAEGTSGTAECDGNCGAIYMLFQGVIHCLMLNSDSSLGLMALRIKCPNLIHLATLLY